MAKDIRVLVVDDEAAVRRLMKRTLTAHGYVVSEAADGSSALALVQDEEFDVVLLDQGLPDIPGMEVLQRLRGARATATVPVLLVTGRGSVPDRVEGLTAGANDYLVKPVDLDELVARVDAQVRGRAAWRTEVADALSERAALAASLASIDLPEVGEAAQRVAELLVQIPELSRVAVFDMTAAIPVLLADTLVGASPTGSVPRAEPISPSIAAELRQSIAQRSRSLPSRVSDRVLPESTGVVTALGVEHGGAPVAALVVEATGDLSIRRDADAAVTDLLPVIDRVLGPCVMARRGLGASVADIRALIESRAFHPVYQPIFDLRTHVVVGFEALTRFDDGTPPDVRFAQAASLRADLGLELEVVTLEAALREAHALPIDRYVSYNVSAGLLLQGRLGAILAASDGHQTVLEITEHERIDDYPAVQRAMAQLGDRVGLSVDDAGSGWASLRHVLALRPDYVKLDRGWVHEIDRDPARQALLLGIGRFVDQMGGRVIAEGIESGLERDTLRDLGIHSGQGFHLGRPARAAELQRG